MGRRHGNGHRDQRYEQRRFGIELERLLGRSRLSARGLAGRIERDSSTVNGWIRGRALPSEEDDIESLARILRGDAEKLNALADFDEAVLRIRRAPIRPAEADAMISSLERGLDVVTSERGATAAHR